MARSVRHVLSIGGGWPHTEDSDGVTGTSDIKPAVIYVSTGVHNAVCTKRRCHVAARASRATLIRIVASHCWCRIAAHTSQSVRTDVRLEVLGARALLPPGTMHYSRPVARFSTVTTPHRGRGGRSRSLAMPEPSRGRSSLARRPGSARLFNAHALQFWRAYSCNYFPIASGERSREDGSHADRKIQQNYTEFFL